VTVQRQQAVLHPLQQQCGIVLACHQP
jgi:hypothetical protein